MANLNKIFLIGNLTRNVELRYVPSGTAVASFGMATNRNYTTQTGEKKQETCFVNIVIWGKQAEACNQYLTKGSLVFVEGRLQYRQWDDPSGQKRSTLEVRADRVQFLGRPMRPTGAVQEPDLRPEEAANHQQMPQPQPQPDPFLNDDDLASHDERDLT